MGVKVWQLSKVSDEFFGFGDVFLGQPAMHQLAEIMGSDISYEDYKRLTSLSIPTEIGGSLYELRCFDIIVGEA